MTTRGTTIGINVGSLLARLFEVIKIAEEYLYARLDNGSNVTVRWAYSVEGAFQISGERSRRLEGRPVIDFEKPPPGSYSSLRLFRGEPGWVGVGTETLTQRLDSREIEQHLPHVRYYTELVFRGGLTMPTLNVLESLLLQLRNNDRDLDF